MSSIDYWRLAEELNLVQITLLILGIDPSEDQLYVEDWDSSKQPKGYSAISTALKNAITSKLLPAKIELMEPDFNENLICWRRTVIQIEDLKAYLKKRNFIDGFFSQNMTTIEHYLDVSNEFYAPKLGAAVAAWKAVAADSTLTNGKTPKQAIDKWLRENAKNYGLTKDDGNPNESAIEEISKICNWNMMGGVAKTPTQVTEYLPTPNLSKTSKAQKSKMPASEPNLPF
jgi:hypothetical protein